MKKKVIQTSIFLFVAILLSRVLGFVREMIIAYNFGASFEADAFYLAFSIPELINKLLFTGALGAIMIPIFIEINSKKSRKEMDQFYNKMNILVFVFTIITSILVISFSNIIIDLIASNMNEDSKSTASNLLKIISFSSIFLSLAGVSKSYLNSLKIFHPTAIAPLIQNSVFIGISILAIPSFGIYSLAYAFLISVIIQYCFQAIFVKQQLTSIKVTNFYMDENVKKVITLSLPAIITLSLTDLNILLDRIFSSSYGNGVVASINYANKILQLPVGIIGATLITMLFPYFTTFVAEKQLDKLSLYFKKAIFLITLIITPISIFIFLYSTDIVAVLFGYGAFDIVAIQLTSLVLKYYIMGLLPIVIVMLLIRVFHSFKDIKTPMIIGIIMTLVKVVISVIFVVDYGYKGLLIGTTVSVYFGCILLLILIIMKLKIKYDRNDFISLIIIILAALMSSFFVTQIFEEQLFDLEIYNLLISLVVFGLIYIIIYYSLNTINKKII